MYLLLNIDHVAKLPIPRRTFPEEILYFGADLCF